MRPDQSPRTVRVVGGLLAAAWIVGGAAGFAIGILESHWLLAAVGMAALWYGVIWLRAARRGRLLTLAEALAPWRVKSHL